MQYKNVVIVYKNKLKRILELCLTILKLLNGIYITAKN